MTIKRWMPWLVLLVGLAALPGLSAGCASSKSGSFPGRESAASASTGTASHVATVAADADRTAVATGMPIVFALISDYGEPGEHEAEVARLVASWKPRFIVTGGDNFHPDAGGYGVSRYNRSASAYYGWWIKRDGADATGVSAGQPAINAFFPALGNHDYRDARPAPRTYMDYFDLPGAGFTSTSANERYYDFVQGPIHFFILDSNPEEPDGTNPGSVQGRWLQRQLAASTSTWNVVVTHHPPYSSGTLHGSVKYMRWPFAEWGADVVISGHDHTYERIMRDGIVYFVNGLGGEGDRGRFNSPRTGSAIRYRDGRGAQKVTVTDTTLDFQFYDTRGKLIDSYRLTAEGPAPGT